MGTNGAVVSSVALLTYSVSVYCLAGLACDSWATHVVDCRGMCKSVPLQQKSTSSVPGPTSSSLSGQLMRVALFVTLLQLLSHVFAMLLAQEAE
eukprot:1157862-Pelagomonas_calceolata.AAC.17